MSDDKRVHIFLGKCECSILKWMYNLVFYISMAGHSRLQYFSASSLSRSIFRWSVPVFNIQDMCKAQGRGAPWCNLLKTRATCLFTSEIPAQTARCIFNPRPRRLQRAAALWADCRISRSLPRLHCFTFYWTFLR